MKDQKAGTAATIAIVAAIGSFLLTVSGNPIWGLVIALLAIIMGIVGVTMSVSPKIGGGLMSIISIIFGVGDIGVSVLVILGILIF